MKNNPELKLEHLAPYLPYGLKIHQDGGYPIKMCAADIMSLLDDGSGYDYGKPILLPLSDLTKPILHNGEKFVPDQILQKYVNANNGLLKYKKQNVYDLNSCEYWIVEKLLEWKFDVHGLIDAGLATSVHELSENPYK